MPSEKNQPHYVKCAKQVNLQKAGWWLPGGVGQGGDKGIVAPGCVGFLIGVMVV